MQRSVQRNSRIISLILLVSIVFSFQVQANGPCITLPSINTNTISYDDNITISSFDGVKIAANIFIPKSTRPANGYPTIIFVNSWASEEHQYLAQAINFAKNGYLVFSYSARGWGCSTGVVDTIGEKDYKDTTAVINYLDKHYRDDVDINNIGISGISYGGGVSLRAAAHDSRIKTVVAMSTPTNLVESLYGEKTLRLIWGGLLTIAGEFTSNLDPIVASNYFDIMFNRNVTAATNWAKARSPLKDIDKLNSRRVPIYIANSFGDNLFQPNPTIDFFEKLTGPKRLDLNQGSHGTFEVPGLVFLPNYVWKNTKDWFDYWLKGVNNGIMNKPPVTMLSENTQKRSEYSAWPIPQRKSKTLHLKPQSAFSAGQLSTSKYNKWYKRSNTFYSGLDSGATTGIPILSELVSGYTKVPIVHYLPLTNKAHGIVHQSSRFDNGLLIRGIPKISLNITPSVRDFTLVAYLYDLDKYGMGRLITHAPISVRGASPFRPRQVSLDLMAAAYDLPRGHRLALIVDTQDLLYSPATLIPHSIKVNYSRTRDSHIKIPYVD